MKNFVKTLRDVVFVWGTLSALFVGGLSYFHECGDCLELYAVEIGLGVLSVVTSAIIWYVMTRRMQQVENKVDHGIESLQVRQIKSDVDRFFKDHKDDQYLSEDDMQYVYTLDEERKACGINSYTQRKLEHLKSKQVR